MFVIMHLYPQIDHITAGTYTLGRLLWSEAAGCTHVLSAKPMCKHVFYFDWCLLWARTFKGA